MTPNDLITILTNSDRKYATIQDGLYIGVDQIFMEYVDQKLVITFMSGKETIWKSESMHICNNDTLTVSSSFYMKADL